jgi:eukaryotic-like serine/threonine-protein kinase
LTHIGRYRIVEKLGQGGMGVVYQAFDPQIERTVAIKLISGALLDNPDLRERFFREARAAGQLSHKNIIVVYDLGEHEGQPYLAMEYLDGGTLDLLMHRPEPLPLATALDIVLEVCDGLGFAHDRGIIHRDIKPANIMVTRAGQVKILDFGLARLMSSDLTRSNLMLGSMNYMAPEQIRAEHVDHRADIFAVGTMLYELVCGHRAFEGESMAATIYKVLQDEPPPLEQRTPSAPAGLGAIVARAMSKDREQRHSRVQDLARELWAVRATLGEVSFSVGGLTDAPTLSETVVEHLSQQPTMISDAPRIVRPRSSPPPQPKPATMATPEPQLSRSRLPVWALGGAALLALAGVGGWWYQRDRSIPPAVTQPRAPAHPAVSSVPGHPDTTGAQVPVDPVPPAEHVTRGREAMRAGDLQTAQREAREALAAAPSNAEARQLVAQLTAKANRENADEAMRDARVARGRADAAQASAWAPEVFAAGQRAQAEADRRYRSQDYAAAAARLYEAAGLYRSAEIDARRVAAATAASAAAARERPAETQPAPPIAPPPIVPAPPQAPATVPPPSAPIPSASPPAPQPTPAIPPATPPPPTADARSDDDIRLVLERYVAALEARSLAALKRIWPALSGSQEQAIRTEFDNARSIDVELASPRITIAGDAATVVAVRHYRLEMRDGHRLQNDTRSTIVLKKNGNAWVIEQIRHEPL